MLDHVSTEAFAAIRPKLAFQIGGILARIHGVDTALLPMLPRKSAASEVTDMHETYRRFSQPRPVFELSFCWLRERMDTDAAAHTLVHGDFRNGNMIVGPDGLRAVLDWELAHLGDPMSDLGWLCTNSWRCGEIDKPVGGFGDRDDLVAGYEAAGGAAPGSVFRFASPSDAIIVTSGGLVETDIGLRHAPFEARVGEQARRLDQALVKRKVRDQISRTRSRLFALGSVTLNGPPIRSFVISKRCSIGRASSCPMVLVRWRSTICRYTSPPRLTRG